MTNQLITHRLPIDYLLIIYLYLDLCMMWTGFHPKCRKTEARLILMKYVRNTISVIKILVNRLRFVSLFHPEIAQAFAGISARLVK